MGRRSGRQVSSIHKIFPRKRVSPICPAMREKTRLEVPESPSCSRLPKAASASSMTTTTGPMARNTLSTRSKFFSVSHWAANQVAHRKGLRISALQELRILTQPLLHGSVPYQHVGIPLGLHELEQAAALTFDQFLLQRPHPRGVQTVSGFKSGLYQNIDIDARNSGGEASQFRLRIVGNCLDVAAFQSKAQKTPTRGFIGHGDFDTGNIRIGCNPFT